jgi:hypothetical protein
MCKTKFIIYYTSLPIDFNEPILTEWMEVMVILTPWKKKEKGSSSIA